MSKNNKQKNKEISARCTDFIQGHRAHLNQYLRSCLLKEVEGIPYSQEPTDQGICVRAVKGMVEGGRNIRILAEFQISIWGKMESFAIRNERPVDGPFDTMQITKFEWAIQKSVDSIRTILGQKLCSAINKRDLGFSISYSSELKQIRNIYLMSSYASEIGDSLFMTNIHKELKETLKNHCPDAIHLISNIISITGRTMQINLKITADYPYSNKTICYSTIVSLSSLLPENIVAQGSLNEVIEFISKKINISKFKTHISNFPMMIKAVDCENPLYKQVQEKMACAVALNRHVRFTCFGLLKEALLEEYSDHIILRNSDIFFDSRESKNKLPNSVYAAAEFALSLSDKYEKRICKTNDFCKFIKDNGNHGHWEAHYVCSNCGRIEKVQFSECPCCHANMDGFDQYISEEGTKLKKWYTVRFRAKLDEDDVRAMNSCFYEAMDEFMLISECENLKIEAKPGEEKGSSKKWCAVTFGAKLDKDDISAMNSCFYEAMSESMLIQECADLEIKEEEKDENNG